MNTVELFDILHHHQPFTNQNGLISVLIVAIAVPENQDINLVKHILALRVIEWTLEKAIAITQLLISNGMRECCPLLRDAFTPDFDINERECFHAMKGKNLQMIQYLYEVHGAIDIRPQTVVRVLDSPEIMVYLMRDLKPTDQDEFKAVFEKLRPNVIYDVYMKLQEYLSGPSPSNRERYVELFHTLGM